MRGRMFFTRRMVSRDCQCHFWSNSSPPPWPTRKNTRKGSFLLGRDTKITMWVFPFSCSYILYIDLYDRIIYCQFVWPIYVLYLPLTIVCGFITGSCYSLSFQIWPLSQRMTWKQRNPDGTLHFPFKHGNGEFLSITWTRGCDPTTTIAMKKIRSLDMFGWVNVWSPDFRNFHYIVVWLECDLFVGVSS